MWCHRSWKHRDISFIPKIGRNFIKNLLVLWRTTTTKESKSFLLATIISTIRRATMMNKNRIIVVTNLFLFSVNGDLLIIMSVSIRVHIKKLRIELHFHRIPQVMSGRCMLLNPLRWVIIHDDTLTWVHLKLLSKSIFFTRLFIIETVSIFLWVELMSVSWMILFRPLLCLFLNLRRKFRILFMQISWFRSIQTFFLITWTLVYSMIHALNRPLLVYDWGTLWLSFETALTCTIWTFGEVKILNELRAFLVDVINETRAHTMRLWMIVIACIYPRAPFFLSFRDNTCHIFLRLLGNAGLWTGTFKLKVVSGCIGRFTVLQIVLFLEIWSLSPDKWSHLGFRMVCIKANYWTRSST